MKSADLTSVAERFEIFHPSPAAVHQAGRDGLFRVGFFAVGADGQSHLFPGDRAGDPGRPGSGDEERILSLLWPQAPGARRLAA